MGGGHRCVLVGQIRRCGLVHCRGLSSIPGSAIFPDVFCELTPSDASEQPRKPWLNVWPGGRRFRTTVHSHETCCCITWLAFVSRDLFLCHATRFCITWLVSVSRDSFLYHVTRFCITWLVSVSRDSFLYYVTCFCITWLVSISRDLLPSRSTWELRSSGLHPSPLISCTSHYSWTRLTRTLVIRTTNCPDPLGPSGKFVENYTKLTCLEITGYRIKYSTVLWLTELQIGRGRKV
jgi:hypothetical protein